MQRTNSMLIVSTKSKNFNPTNLVYYLKLTFPLYRLTAIHFSVGLIVLHRILLLVGDGMRLQV